MDDKDRQEWSQHYDKLQWVVITIASAGIGALVVASFNPSNNNEIWPDILGLALMILGAAYVASFRAFRAHLHQGIKDKQLSAFLGDPGKTKWPKQWDLFVASLVAVDITFVYRLTEKGHYPWVVRCILFFITVFFLGAIWWKGLPEKNK